MVARSLIVTLLGGVSALSIASSAQAQAVQAQEQASPPKQGATVSEVVVTGSRIVKDGFKAPTPVTTVTSEDLVQRAPSSIPDALNKLPQFTASTGNKDSPINRANNPTFGNYLNLRNLGTQRSLIMLDGVRVPPTSFTGGVDVNTLPQALIQRVDIVTGGASAAYGSDAIVGVVNFILDRNFTGVKTLVQGGISSRGDAESWKVSAAAGTKFLDGRGHVEVSAEQYKEEGLSSYTDREIARNCGQIGAGTAAVPFRIICGATMNGLSFGGLVRSGPFNGLQFAPDGRLVPFNAGTPTATASLSIGGDGGYYQPASLTGNLRTDQGFARVSYELTPAIVASAQASVAESRNDFIGVADQRLPGSANAVTIFSGNAFLRPEVQAALGATPSFQLGRFNREIPQFPVDTLNSSFNAKVQLEGHLQNHWNWDVYLVRGESRLRNKSIETNNLRFFAAADAVRDASGQIVCRVTITNPGLYPGCVPMDLFGAGAISPEAVKYVLGPTQYQIENNLSVAGANLRGDLLNLWAGPLSFGVGLEARSQKMIQTSNADPAQPLNTTGLRGVPSNALLFRNVNQGVATGEVNVKEAYGEFALPLLKDLPMVQSLDLNAAARLTDYSTSGLVTTWKVGLSYLPFKDLRIRSTVSRDIAAPTLYQLFAGESKTVATTLDPHTNVVAQSIQVSGGNPDLKPEVSSMVVLGAVYSPSWIPGFTASVDGYSVQIDGAIAASTVQDQLTSCERANGTGPICDLITRPRPFSDRTPANFPLFVKTLPLNLAEEFQEGVDLEVAYATPMDRFVPAWSGSLNFRMLASFLVKNETKDSASLPTVDNTGYGPNIRAKGSFSITYVNDALTLRLNERFTGSSKRSNTQFYADMATEPNLFYTDIYAAYKFGAHRQYEGFVTIENLFDQAPPLTMGETLPGLTFPTDKTLYDVVGRYFTVGLRAKF